MYSMPGICFLYSQEDELVRDPIIKRRLKRAEELIDASPKKARGPWSKRGWVEKSIGANKCTRTRQKIIYVHGYDYQ